jgi:hypothetical protein
VKLTLKEPMDVHLFVAPVKCSRLYVSLEQPDQFLKEIGKAPSEQPEVRRAA